MSDLLTALERAERAIPPASPPTVDAFVAYRGRRARRQRVTAAVVTIALVVLAVLGGVRLLRDAERRVPADLTETPSAYRLDVLPEIPSDLHAPPDLRSQAIVAAGSFGDIPWSVRTNQDASCVAFVREDGNTKSGSYGGELWGLVGPGGAAESCELDRPGDLMAVGSGKTDGPLGFLLFGTVAPQVRTVDVAIDGFGPVDAVVLTTPGQTGAEVRYFVAASGPGVTHGLVGSVSVIGEDEQTLATYRFPSDADGPGGISAPIQTLWSVPWSGKLRIGVWRNGIGDLCFGEVGGEEGYGGGYGRLPPQGPGCTTREHLFDGLREGDIAIADAAVFTSRGSIYQAWGTASEAVAEVRVEFPGGRVVSVALHAADGSRIWARCSPSHGARTPPTASEGA